MSNFQSYSSYIPNADQEVFAQAGVQIREDSPVHRVGSFQGSISTETTEQSTDRGNSGQINPHSGSGSWQASARTKTGGAVSEITPETLVEFDGVQAQVKFWVGEGRLTKAADGSFSESTGTAPAQQTAPDANYSQISDQAQEQVNMLLEPLPQGSLDSFMAHASGVASGRLDDASLTAKFATQAGLSIEDSASRLTVLKGIYQGATDRAIASRGIGAEDKDAFYAWAKSSHQGELGEAISRQLHGNDVSGWNPLAAKWLNTTAPTLEAFKASGIPTRNGHKGAEVLLRGMWLSPIAATRAGMV